MKKALVTGITGQDGAYLAKLLVEKGYHVFGTYRRLSTPNFWRVLYLGIFDKISLLPADLTDTTSLLHVITFAEPDEVYNLAAQSFVETSFEQPISTADVTGVGATRLLEMIRQLNPKIKFYQASSSEQYGNNSSAILSETMPFIPASPYAAAKVYACHMTRIYREAYGVFACNGLLFNHESPLRGLEFVTRKVSNAVARIKLGLQKELVIGNLEAKRDWGYAPEYVEAMWRMLQADEADDYIIATGESHSVKEFVSEAFGLVGLDWTEYVRTDKQFFRPLDVNFLLGDYSKAKEKLGWEPKIKFAELTKLMVRADLERWQRAQRGERFPWDAMNDLTSVGRDK